MTRRWRAREALGGLGYAIADGTRRGLCFVVLAALSRSVIDLLTKTWVIAAITIVICAGFLAKAVGSIVAAETLPEATKSTVPIAPPKPVVAQKAKLDGAKIARNIFCSTCEPSPIVAGNGGQYTGEPAVLIATMMGPDPRATVRVLASEAQGSWGVGERIPGVGTVDRIGSTSIDVVDVAGHRGTISLLETAADQPTKTAGAATPDTAGPADPFADKVRKIAENDYEVDRTLVRDLVASASKPQGGFRVVPQMKGNEVNGVRFIGVRAGSPPSAVGIKSNDVISTVGGEPLKNVNQMLDLYAKLDQLSAVEFGGTRGGKPFTLTLRLR